MSLTTDDIQQITAIITAAVTASEERLETKLHSQIVRSAEYLGSRIDETHVRIDALRIETRRDTEMLAQAITRLEPSRRSA